MTHRSLFSFRSGLWAGLLLLTGVLLAEPAHAQPAVEREGDGYTATVTRTFSVGSDGTFDLESRGGPIQVETWGRSEVEVVETVRMRDYDREEAERYVRDYTTEYSESGSTVQVRGPSDRSSVSRDFSVRLPRAFAAEVRTRGGPISVEGVQGRLVAETSGGPISVTDAGGPVDVETSGGPIRLENVTGTVRAQTAGGSIEARRVGGRVTLDTAGGSIRVEEAGGDVEAETAGGGIRIDGVQGDVVAETAGGDVEVSNAQKSVDAQTAGGDVELESIAGPVTARTSGGDIEGRGLGGRVDARTSAGDIELEDVRAGVNARASVGDVEVEMTMSSFEGDYASSLESTLGDVRLVLPARIPATLSAEVESLYGSVDREDIYSDFPVTRELSEDGDELRASGTFNGGGPEIDLRSKGGSIKIIKR